MSIHHPEQGTQIIELEAAGLDMKGLSQVREVLLEEGYTVTDGEVELAVPNRGRLEVQPEPSDKTFARLRKFGRVGLAPLPKIA